MSAVVCVLFCGNEFVCGGLCAWVCVVVNGEVC